MCDASVNTPAAFYRYWVLLNGTAHYHGFVRYRYMYKYKYAVYVYNFITGLTLIVCRQDLTENLMDAGNSTRDGGGRFYLLFSFFFVLSLPLFFFSSHSLLRYSA